MTWNSGPCLTGRSLAHPAAGLWAGQAAAQGPPDEEEETLADRLDEQAAWEAVEALDDPVPEEHGP